MVLICALQLRAKMVATETRLNEAFVIGTPIDRRVESSTSGSQLGQQQDPSNVGDNGEDPDAEGIPDDDVEGLSFPLESGKCWSVQNHSPEIR